MDKKKTLMQMVDDPTLMRLHAFTSDFPALDAMFGFDQQNPHHDMDLMEHSIAVAMGVPRTHIIARIAALFHDAGKVQTQVIDGGHARYHGHDDVGADLARRDLVDVLPNFIVDDVALLIKNHMRPLGYVNQPFKNKGVKRLIKKSRGHNVDIDDLMVLNHSDILAHDDASVGRTLPGHMRLRDHIERVRDAVDA